MIELSIYMPTHYSEPRNLAAIFQLIAAAHSNPSIEVVISDNSKSAEKRELLSPYLSERVRLLEGPERDNYRFALQQCRSQWVMPMGDDDQLLAAAIPSMLRVASANPKAVAVAGTFVRELPGGYDLFKPGPLDGALEGRVGAWLDLGVRGNPLFHVIARANVMKDAYRVMFDAPNAQAYHDQLATLYLASAGPFALTASPFFIYNFGNWTGEQRLTSELKHIRASGLPVSLLLIQRLLLAVEGFFLIRGPAIPGAEEEKAAAAKRWFAHWARWWNGALKEYDACSELLDCPWSETVRRIVAQAKGNDTLHPWHLAASFASLYEQVNGTGRAYLNHWHMEGIA